MILIYLVYLVFVYTNVGNASRYECSSTVIPDLDGSWVCDDIWLVSHEEVISDYEESRKWKLFFKLPKFYAVSKIVAQTTTCDTDLAVIVRAEASVWDERFDRSDDDDIADASEAYWVPINIANTSFTDDGYQEYSGFARRSTYWRLTIETVGMNEDCLPKFMFFARAGVAAVQHYVMELDFPYAHEPSSDADMYVNAPTSNTCNQVTGVPPEVVSRYRLDTSFYRKYTSAYGIPVMGSSNLDGRALQRACYVVRFMMADRKDLRDHMYRNKGRVAIIGRRETVPMVPEMRQYTWWTRRAAGGTFHNPVNVGAEENMLCERGDGYARNQDIFMHEFAHGIHLIACHTAIPNFNSRLQRSFNYARSRGLWTNTYANTDNREYFAEGVQAFFEQQREGPVGGDGIQNHINTREELKRHDPTLYKIIDELFPCYNDYLPRCDDISQGIGLARKLKMDCKDGVGTVAPPTTATTQKPESCTNEHESCDEWAGSGECQKNPDIMLFICKKSCKVCTITPPGTTKPPTTTSTTTTRSCIDENTSCNYWAGIGECEKNPEYMKDKCRKSCNSCTGGTTTTGPPTTTTTTTATPKPTTTATSTTTTNTTITPTPTTTTSPTACTDDDESCFDWAKNGECEKNPDIILHICKKSCKVCSGPPGTTKPPTTTKQSTATPTPPTTTTTTTTSVPPKPCMDENNSCSYWASIGECDKNPDYMKTSCRKSCKECSGGSSCSDDDQQCSSWSSYCSSNSYVITNCKKTCGTC